MWHLDRYAYRRMFWLSQVKGDVGLSDYFALQWATNNHQKLMFIRVCCKLFLTYKEHSTVEHDVLIYDSDFGESSLFDPSAQPVDDTIGIET